LISAWHAAPGSHPAREFARGKISAVTGQPRRLHAVRGYYLAVMAAATIRPARTSGSVAAVVTNFRHGKFLLEAVGSVRSQTRPVDEIIVVDDASGPDEEQFLQQLGQDVCLIRLERNSGPGGARQAGSDASRCEWLAYLDADDLWVPQKVELQLAHLQSVGNPPVSHTGTVVFASDGSEREFVDVKPLELTLADQLKRNQVAPPTVMLHADLLADVGGWKTGHEIIEDWDLFIRVASAGHRVVSLREPLTRVRRTGHNHLSSSGQAQLRRLVATLEHHRSTIDTHLGAGAYASSLREVLLDHRHKLPRVRQAKLILAAHAAGIGVPRPAWNWLI
jgi:glycosyltransferase involved in cell wall biosynthesis